jgi:hypothetical protein
MGGRYREVVDALMKSLPGAAAHPAPLPQGKVALFVVWTRFENMSEDQRKRMVQDAIIGSSRVSAVDLFSGIHCYTPSQYDELQRNDILAFPGEEFRVPISLLRETVPGDTLEVEWSGPIDSEAGQDLRVYASTVERVTGTIYNVKGTVPAGHPAGHYRNVKAFVKDRSGNTVEVITDLMRPHLSVQRVERSAS